RRDGGPERVLASFAARAGSLNERGDPVDFLSFGWKCADLRAPADKRWTVNAGFYGEEGLRIIDEAAGYKELLRLSLATPWASWPMRSATVTPSGLVVFQAGDSHIMVLDPERKTMGVLAIGASPVVAHD